MTPNLSLGNLILDAAFFCAIALSIAAQSHANQTTDGPTRVDSELLAKHQVESTTTGVTAYLDQLKPNEALLQQATTLIHQLDNTDYSIRESATRNLIELPTVPLQLLRETANSTNLEMALRARKVLGHAQTQEKLHAIEQRNEVVSAVLRMVRDRPIENMTAKILEVAPYLDDANTTLAADAVRTIATSEEVPLLRQALSANNINLRIIAIRGLGKSAGPPFKPELLKHCGDANPRIALAAAHALAAQSDRDALAPLINLLASKQVSVRVGGTQILRSLTGQNLEFNPYSKVETQRVQLERWRTWLTQRGAVATLQVPIKIATLPEELRHGLLLQYTFDADSSERLNDSSGKGQRGTRQNATRFIEHGEGKALKITGTGHHGDRGGHAIIPTIQFPTLDEFTISLWVNETGMSHPEGEAYIVFGVDRGVTFKDAIGISHFNASLLFRVGDGEIEVPFKAIDRGQWVHYAITYKSNRLIAYRNGQSIGSAAANVSMKGNQAALGRHWWNNGSGTSSRFQGAIDDVRVYDRALTSEQLGLLFRQE